MTVKTVLDADVYPRVLLVVPSLSGGGAENRCRLTAENLFGGKTAVAVFKDDGGATMSKGQPVLNLKWASLRSYPSMIRILRRHLKRHHFNALFAFGFYPNLVAWSAVQGLLCRPALILTEIIAPRRDRQQIRGIIRRIAVERLRRLIYPRADLFAANSEDGLKETIEYYGVNSKRARRIANLIDPNSIEQLAATGKPQNASGRVLSICLAARLTRQKQIETLLKAAARLHLQLDWRIDIVGDGEERAMLENLACQLGVATRIRFHGWLTNPYPIISQADVFVLCSAYEGFSNSVLESMILRTPVITSLCTADAHDMCTRGAALGFPVGDHSALRTQIIRVLECQALREKLSANAWAYVQRHTVPLAIGEYESLILDAICINQH